PRTSGLHRPVGAERSTGRSRSECLSSCQPPPDDEHALQGGPRGGRRSHEVLLRSADSVTSTDSRAKPPTWERRAPSSATGGIRSVPPSESSSSVATKSKPLPEPAIGIAEGSSGLANAIVHTKSKSHLSRL